MGNTLNTISAGLPISAKDLLSEALQKAFGKDVVDMIELDKDNLRSKVRLSRRDVKVVLVVLDGTSTDICKDIEGGLYNSEKFHTYVDDETFVDFLNTKFGLSLELPKQEEQSISQVEEASGVSIEVLEMYEAQIKDKDLMICNLQCQVEALNKQIKEYEYEGATLGVLPEENEKLNALKEDNLELRGTISTLEGTVSERDSEIKLLKEERDRLEKSIKDLEEKRNSLLADYESMNSELTDLKVTNSKQSGVIRDKNKEIDSLREKLRTVTELEELVKTLKSDCYKFEKQANDSSRESSNLSAELVSKTEEVERLRQEVEALGVTDELLVKVKEDLQRITEERDGLLKEVSERDSMTEELQNVINDANELIENLKIKVSQLEERVAQDNKDLTTLNEEKLKLQGEVRVLQQSTDRNTNIEAMVSEVAELRKSYDDMKNSVFGRISALALPKGSSSVQLIRGSSRYNNIRFVFAGSTESRKGAYRCLLDEFKKLPSTEKVLIVDVVSETSVDYVFEISKVNSGVEWFRRGGSVQPYLSNTCLNNVRVLSPGLGYINDSYFLTINWESRLAELENSGYQVILFCGDISNIVGRVLHESFASLGTSFIYVHGNAIGSRTLVSNLKGLTNASSSIVAYFEFNTKMRRFYEIVEKTNECRVLSMIDKR